MGLKNARSVITLSILDRGTQAQIDKGKVSPDKQEHEAVCTASARTTPVVVELRFQSPVLATNHLATRTLQTGSNYTCRNGGLGSYCCNSSQGTKGTVPQPQTSSTLRHFSKRTQMASL